MKVFLSLSCQYNWTGTQRFQIRCVSSTLPKTKMEVKRVAVNYCCKALNLKNLRESWILLPGYSFCKLKNLSSSAYLLSRYSDINLISQLDIILLHQPKDKETANKLTPAFLQHPSRAQYIIRQSLLTVSCFASAKKEISS